MNNKYRKLPVEIEARQFDGTQHEAESIVGWVIGGGSEARLVKELNFSGPATFVIDIKTLEGVMHTSTGDFVIKGVKGEFYPCNPDIFLATYEKVV